MSKADLSKIKTDIAQYLREFGNDLYRLKVITDDAPFKDASNQCKSGPLPVIKGKKIDYSNCWGYDLTNVVFRIQERKKAHNVSPQGAMVTSIVMDVRVIGNLIDSRCVSDPFSHLEFNVIINAETSAKVPLISCWHLDRDLEGKDEPEDFHPVYHFTFGGKKLKLEDKIFNYGNNIILDTPRFAHLPLEAILGVDFILSNYYGNVRRRICEESIFYKNYLNKLQELIWRPYACASASHWTSYTPQTTDWPSEKIWPQLIIPDVIPIMPKTKGKKQR